jgi:predicted component of type VI protein secretion system
MLHHSFATASENESHGPAGLSASAASDYSPNDVARMRADLDRLLRQQAELMQLIGTTRPERLIHDIRNVLQERMLLEAACKRYGV